MNDMRGCTFRFWPCCLQENRMELGSDLDIGLYVASGVVAFDLHRRTIKWSQVRVQEEDGR